MEKTTLFDDIGALSMGLLIHGIEREGQNAIKKLEKESDRRTIFGIVSAISDSAVVPGQKVVKIVPVDDNGKWNKQDKGIYIKIPPENIDTYSTPVSDVFIGDRIMVTLCPPFSLHGTNELECFCYDMRVGSGWALEDGKIADYEEQTEENRIEYEEKIKKSTPWANLGLLFSIVSFLIGLTSFRSAACGLIGIIFGIKSMMIVESKRNNAAIIIGGIAILSWIIVLFA